MILIRYYSFSYILLCTSISSFSCWQSITIYLKVLALSITLIKILPSAILILWAAIEVIEHKVHIFSLFSLEMVLDVLISMNFYFDMCICLPWKSSRLSKSIIIDLLVRLITLSLACMELLFLLRVITDIECFPASSLDSIRARCLSKRLSLKISMVGSWDIGSCCSLYSTIRMKSLLVLD